MLSKNIIRFSLVWPLSYEAWLAVLVSVLAGFVTGFVIEYVTTDKTNVSKQSKSTTAVLSKSFNDLMCAVLGQGKKI